MTAFRPQAVHNACRKAYPAYRWLTEHVGFRSTPWARLTVPSELQRKSWGKVRKWAIYVDEYGATMTFPDGDTVFWPTPEKP